jgi:flavin reductase (DIM6/NTAB) family NADH-FMN oxidoreductase RutF
VDYSTGGATFQLSTKNSISSFTPIESSKIGTPIIEECPYNMECKISQEIDVGGWVLILGEILESHVDEDKVALSKEAKIDMSKVNPLVYCAKVREYWSMGDKLGDGFEAGKELMKGLKQTNET